MNFNINTYYIFKRLAQSDTAVSGDLLGTELGISRAGVNKHIKKLQADGIAIESSKNGYVYKKSDCLTVYTLKYRLESKGLDLDTVIEVTDSTNNLAKKIANTGTDKKDFAVAAPYQTSGRGRLDRGFASAEGGAYFSVCMYPKSLTVAESLRAVLITGLAVARTLKKYGIKSTLKWPNDVFAGDKKICGILLESVLNSEYIERLVSGIGINVSNPVAEGLEDVMTTIKEETGQTVIREEVIATAIGELYGLYQEYEKNGFNTIKEEYISISRSIGHDIAVKSINGVLEGFAEGITDEGYLLLRGRDGTVNTIVTGDIVPSEQNE